MKGFQFSRDDLQDDESQLLINGMQTVTVEQVNQLAQGYLDEVAKRNDTAPRMTDKMPYNFLMLPLIKKLFPNAAVIHCRRNPIDTCLSCYFQNFFRGNQYAFDLTSLAEYYLQYQSLMASWRDELKLEFLDLDYEMLVKDPTERVREILEYCQLPWHDGCLEFHKSKRVIDTASYQQVRQPIYTKSVARWEKYREHISPLLQAFGES